MPTSIRLKRMGAKKEASFRIVVIDSREGTAGAAIERLGRYNPRTKPSLIELNAPRTIHWLREGAQPSDSVRSLLRKTGVWKQFHDGVEPDSFEEAMIVVGPPPGERGTSQRPPPTDREPKSYDAPAAPEPEPAAEAEPAESDAAEEEAAEEPVAEAAEEAAEAEEPAAEETAEEPAAEAAEEAEEAPAAEAEEAPADAEDDAPADEAPEETEAEAEGDSDDAEEDEKEES
ncbi:MAG: 30S ribosomal protein S16 [Gemmatimonadetes bacterium]|nr:30S ribosomal protein S16 [Gemmatimonadota bacterium]